MPSIKFNVRNIGGGIKEVHVWIGDVSVSLGWMQESESALLAAYLRDVADDLQPSEE